MQENDLNVTAVSPICVELIEFGDKHGANMWLLTWRKKNKLIVYYSEIEIVAGVFSPVAEGYTENSIESYSALKIFVTVINTLLNPMCLSMVELLEKKWIYSTNSWW